jgi:hypothetical protein
VIAPRIHLPGLQRSDCSDPKTFSMDFGYRDTGYNVHEVGWFWSEAQERRYEREHAKTKAELPTDNPSQSPVPWPGLHSMLPGCDSA